ncbi:hypothetical protein FRB97_009423, partial [Tulasnella sp. 331]
MLIHKRGCRHKSGIKDYEEAGMPILEMEDGCPQDARKEGFQSYKQALEESEKDKYGVVIAEEKLDFGIVEVEATLYCPSSYDPAYCKADSIENVASLLHGITTGGPGGGVDWDLVAGNGETSVLDFLKATWTTDLALEFGVTPAALTAKKLISTSLKVIDALDRLKVIKPEEQVKDVSYRIAGFHTNAMTFAAKGRFKTDMPALQSPGFDQSEILADRKTKVSMLAMKNAQLRLLASKSQLRAQRQMYEKSEQTMRELDSSMGDIMKEIAKLDQVKIEWESIREAPTRAISFFGHLRGCIQDLVSFFAAIDSIVSVNMANRYG